MLKRPRYAAVEINNIKDVVQYVDDSIEIYDYDFMAMDFCKVPVQINHKERAIAKNTTSTCMSRSFCPFIFHCTGVTFNFYWGGFGPNK